MSKRRFVDASGATRCTATIRPLRDGTLAQCGRRGVIGGMCHQHATMPALATAREAIAPLPITSVLAELRGLDPNGDWVNVPEREHDYCREVLAHLRAFGHTEDMEN